MNPKSIIEKYKKENKNLRSELIQRSKELSFFINSGKALTSTLEFNKVLAVIMERAQRLIKCEAWALMLVDEELKQLRFVAIKGGRSREVKAFRLKIGEGIAGWVGKTGKPLIINDARKDKRFNKAVDRITGFKTRSIICVPIINKRRTVGILEMINKSHKVPFEKKDQDLLAKLVGQASIALERASLHRRMSSLAITDDLTKLHNFRYMDQTLDHEINRSQRYGSVLSLIFFDMDHFKIVNDTHGHLAGSKVLVEVADLLRENFRNVDIMARYGGDEFVVILPETSIPGAVRITQRLHKNMGAHQFLKKEGLDIKMSASFGIAGYPEHARTKRDLIRLADQAMYMAKNGGRNQIYLAGKRQRSGKARKV